MKNTQPTLVVKIPEFEFAAVLQLLESQKASGTLACGDLWLRLNEGRIVNSSGDVVDKAACARETVAMLSEVSGELAFWPAFPAVITTKRPQFGPTAILLELACAKDETTR